nr:hypothetical protein K-LCC10_0130 [Kaumoebavirus]
MGYLDELKSIAQGIVATIPELCIAGECRIEGCKYIVEVRNKETQWPRIRIIFNHLDKKWNELDCCMYLRENKRAFVFTREMYHDNIHYLRDYAVSSVIGHLTSKDKKIWNRYIKKEKMRVALEKLEEQVPKPTEMTAPEYLNYLALHLQYAPGSEGAEAAKEHFENLNK